MKKTILPAPITALILGLGLLSGGSVMADRVFYDQNWYVSSLEIDPASLPKEIKVTPKKVDIGSPGSSGLLLRNPSSTPFYVVKKVGPLDWLKAFPVEYAPLWRLHDGVMDGWFDSNWRKESTGVSWDMILHLVGLDVWHQELKGSDQPDFKPKEKGVKLVGRKLNAAVFYKGSIREFRAGVKEQVDYDHRSGAIVGGHLEGSEFSFLATDTLGIKNPTHEPLIFIKKMPESMKEGMKQIRSFGNDRLPVLRLQADESFTPVTESADRISWELKSAWLESAQKGEGGAMTVAFIAEQIGSKTFEKNGPGRDRSQQAPAPEPFEIHSRYGTKDQVIRGKIVYSLNPAYRDPSSPEQR